MYKYKLHLIINQSISLGNAEKLGKWSYSYIWPGNITTKCIVEHVVISLFFHFDSAMRWKWAPQIHNVFNKRITCNKYVVCGGHYHTPKSHPSMLIYCNTFRSYSESNLKHCMYFTWVQPLFYDIVFLGHCLADCWNFKVFKYESRNERK